MEVVSLAALSVNFLGLCLCASSLKVYYVKPAGPSSSSSSSSSSSPSPSVCPSDGLPCHSLQYYVNHSNFTNNSQFLFLPGEHHLDSVVNISNVANLSLEGAKMGKGKILCTSFPSGFNIREFTGLSIKKMAVSTCGSVTFNLESGSELSVDNVSVSTSSGDITGFKITSVTGSIRVSNSFFSGLRGSGLALNYTNCNQPSDFSFSKSEVMIDADEDTYGLIVHMHCSDVRVVLADSIFNQNTNEFLFNLCVANVSVIASNITGSILTWTTPRDKNCKIDHAQNLMSFTHVTITSFHVILPKINGTVAINDSVINELYFYSDFDSRQRMKDASLKAKFEGVTFNNGCVFRQVNVWIVNCSFENSTKSAIQALSSKIHFKGSNTFKNNSALIGAGIQLIKFSYMLLQSQTSILFRDNHAEHVGGAIYTDSQGLDPCFFQVEVDSVSLNETIEVNFMNNSADLGGFSLYGNNLSQCENLYNFFSKIYNTESVPSAVGSDPHKVCFCENGKNRPNCTVSSKDIRVFPGEDFILRLAVVGNSFDGTVTGVTRASFVNPDSNTVLGPLQGSQIANKPFCANFTYTIYSTHNGDASFILASKPHFLGQHHYPVLQIHATLSDCPVRFLLSNITGKCVCESTLKDKDITCDINDQLILRPANTWIGFVNASDTPEDVIILFHPHCPIGYCLPYDTNITSNTSDRQCAPHRTGLLCGKCEEGYSLTLGNGTCATCSNTYLLFILPLAVSGLLLVAILFALNLTVTEGTINGLIFYANVLGMNHSTLHSGEVSWLYTFLAWLNLDLGISTCFFDGMDGYAETWLQFIFPIYLWMIVLVIIKLYSKFPRHANRLGGGNAVKVLATLLLLSYTKLQQTVVTIMSFTKLEYPDGVTRYVWLYDANLDYFKGKHIYLGLAGIFALVFLILPYTLCLVFFQQLQACSNHLPFRWVNTFKPLLDSYAGPYKDRYRFWTGMLLLVRTLLIVLFTVNTSASVDFNLLIILTTSLALALANSNGTYIKWPLNYLEVFFYFNLGMFAGGILYARHNSGNVSIRVNISIGLSLAAFLIVLSYHSFLRLKDYRGYYYNLIGYADIEEDDVSLTHERFVN